MLLFLIIIFWFSCSILSVGLFNGFWFGEFGEHFYKKNRKMFISMILFGPFCLLAVIMTLFEETFKHGFKLW